MSFIIIVLTDAMANIRHILDNKMHVLLSDEGLILLLEFAFGACYWQRMHSYLDDYNLTGDIAINIGSLQGIPTMLLL